MTLGFSKSNSKMAVLANYLNVKKSEVVSFDVPAGWTCAKAGICKGFAHKETGKLTQVGRVKCYAVKQENYLPTVRAFRWNNFNQLLACGNDTDKMVELILTSIPKNAKIIRIHSSGDYFKKEYFMAWVRVAYLRPDLTLFGYTKHLDYAKYENKPNNFKLVYSFGSKDDTRFTMEEIENVPACYIEEFAGQYGADIPRVCATHADGWQDYFKILEGESFVIPIH